MLGLEGGARGSVVLGKTQTPAVCPGTVSSWALRPVCAGGEATGRAVGTGVGSAP